LNLNFEKAIIKASESPFKWGINDCCTLILNALGNPVELPRPDYTDLKGALRFNKKYKWEIELEKLGFEKTILKNNVIALVEEKNFQCAHITFENYLYSMDLKKGLVKLPLSLFASNKKIFKCLSQPQQ